MTREESTKFLSETIDYLLENSTADAPAWNIEQKKSGKPNQWNYIDGCMISAVLSLYETTGEERYFSFARRFLDAFVREDGGIRTYDPAAYNLDNVNQGRNLFPLYDLTGEEKYRLAADRIAEQLARQPRTKEGNYWHKNIYPNQVWLDGAYMAQPFHVEYEKRYGTKEGCEDAVLQLRNMERLMRDPVTGLYYHGYDESRTMYWADPITGCSANFWVRAMGWFVAALADVLEKLPSSMEKERRELEDQFLSAVTAFHEFQDPESGMFYQVINRKDAEGNYLETSGTALFAYAVLKGVRLHFLPEFMREWGENAFYGICDRCLSKEEDGSLHLTGICLVAGLGGPSHRDGSLSYYLSEPVVDNDAKGVGPLLLAYTEILAAAKEK